MFKRLKEIIHRWTKPEEPPKVEEPPRKFSTDFLRPGRDVPFMDALSKALVPVNPKHVRATPGIAMDSNFSGIKPLLQYQSSIPESQAQWYISQSFIGYQTCALIAQHWLVHKICHLPADDAISKGYKVTVNDGTKLTPEMETQIMQADHRFCLNENMAQFVTQGRIFGIRIAMFKIDGVDDDFYINPFNIDGIKPGSYMGISQIDPYWTAPELDMEAVSDPSSIHFYDPTWWLINGKRVHRSHLIIMRNTELPDILKPAYLYGGISIPQQVYERVYAAERTANEAPQLALTKRTNVLKVDMMAAIAKQKEFEEKLQNWAYYRDNYGIKAIDLNEETQQFDTSLADLDAVIMTQYQLVAAIACMPADKLMSTTPKGFNATGQFEETSYHEELKRIQHKHLTPLMERHHLLLIKSEIAPNAPFATSTVWNPLDVLTAKEQAEINRLKAETGAGLINAGALSPDDERNRIIADPESGYSGIPAEQTVEPNENDQDEPGDNYEDDEDEI